MELTDAEREDYATEDIPFPEPGAEPAPFEDAGPAVEPAEEAPRETEEAGAREEPPEAGREVAPEGGERERLEAELDAILEALPVGAVPADIKTKIDALTAQIDALPDEEAAEPAPRAAGAPRPSSPQASRGSVVQKGSGL